MGLIKNNIDTTNLATYEISPNQITTQYMNSDQGTNLEKLYDTDGLKLNFMDTEYILRTSPTLCSMLNKTVDSQIGLRLRQQAENLSQKWN